MVVDAVKQTGLTALNARTIAERDVTDAYILAL